ncbi:MAG: hypothetical protein HY509_00260 [Acidobacteria bacterium]|nr:hypothetical protein [Acidobacteriota bacterium]
MTRRNSRGIHVPGPWTRAGGGGLLLAFLVGAGIGCGRGGEGAAPPEAVARDQASPVPGDPEPGNLPNLPGRGDPLGDREEVRPEGWPAPDWKAGTRQARKWLDLTRQIEGEETQADAYVGRDFPLFVVWSLSDEEFAVIVDEDGRGPFEYGLWDRDGDGRFEVKTGPYRMLEPPLWAIERHFLRHGQVPPSRGPESEGEPGGAPRSPTGSE